MPRGRGKRTRASVRYREIIVEREGGAILRGQMWVKNGVVTVTTPDGRQKSTQIGGSPPYSIARWMLIELEEARLGNPIFKLPWE
jgi:hypothetical protein